MQLERQWIDEALDEVEKESHEAEAILKHFVDE